MLNNSYSDPEYDLYFEDYSVKNPNEETRRERQAVHIILFNPEVEKFILQKFTGTKVKYSFLGGGIKPQ